MNLYKPFLTFSSLAFTFLLITFPAFTQKNSSSIVKGTQSSVYVEPVILTETYDKMGPSLNVGVVVHNNEIASGLQKAADIWGINLDLFILDELDKRKEIANFLLDNEVRYLIYEKNKTEDWSTIESKATKLNIPVEICSREGTSGFFEEGFQVFKKVRANILSSLPKYDEIAPIAFPISPLPGSFFQPSKFPYPSPLVRLERTAESGSSSGHAHVSCNMVAQTGNMLHRTSSINSDLFLMGMEGGNLSLEAVPGAVTADKVSAVMTSWVIGVQGKKSSKRDILVENDGIETSVFKVGIHAPEELDIAMNQLKKQGHIKGFRLFNNEELLIVDKNNKERKFRAGMFLIQSDRAVEFPELVFGRDIMGIQTMEFLSTQQFIQQFREMNHQQDYDDLTAISETLLRPTNKVGIFQTDVQIPQGGILTSSGTSVGNTIGSTLGHLLQKVEQETPDFQPYVMSLEGGFIVVTPEIILQPEQLTKKIKRVDLDLRGPLTSDQTILVKLEDDSELVFRRTILNFRELDKALEQLRAQGLVQDWAYEGVRGQGLNANFVLYNFLGKNRKFMSSLCIWPTEERPGQATARFYVDGMQRLNITFITKEGWRQEFVEVPLRIPPVPKDIELYSGISKIE